MKLDKQLVGKYVYLRSVTVDDAEFVCDIRSDAELCKYLHAVSPDVSAQREWIENQIARENDYYFIICDQSDVPVGLASIYDVDTQKKCAEFGRWVSRGNALQNVESVVLSFDFAFETFDLDFVYMRTMMANTAVRTFWTRFGAKSLGEVHEMGLNLDKEIVTAEDYYGGLRERSMRLIRR